MYLWDLGLAGNALDENKNLVSGSIYMITRARLREDNDLQLLNIFSHCDTASLD